jgi:hypothetical protein
MTEAKALQLEPAEAEVVALEAAAFARALPDPVARERYERLAASAAGQGDVPDDLVSPLAAMLELVFDTGRPVNRAVLQAVYGRTPRGRERAADAREVNRALEALRGQTIAELRVAAAGPSQLTLTVETDRVRVQLEFDRHGARVTSLEAG